MEHSEVLEKKEWEYVLRKTGTNYKLVVPQPEPSPGFDVVHYLNPEEIEAYQAEGMDALTGRMEDMQRNYLSYKVQSWR